MGLFNHNYNTPGKGVSKEGRQKTVLFRFFELFFGKFWQLLVLNALYLLMCLPVVTIGAASAGFTYCLKNIIAGKPIFVAHDFFKGFKNNWKQGTVMMLINAVVTVVLLVAFSFYLDAEVIPVEGLRIAFTIFLGAIAILYCMMQFYTYLLMVTFDIKFSALLKNSFLFIVLGIKENLIAMFFTLVYVVLIIWGLFPFSIILVVLFLPALMGTTVNFIVYPVVKRIMIDPYEQEQNNEEERIFEDDVK